MPRCASRPVRWCCGLCATRSCATKTNTFGSRRNGWRYFVGAAGGLGHYAVQWARWGGATVLTTVSSEAKAQHARSAGAHHLINYKTQDVVEAVHEQTGGEGVDRIVVQGAGRAFSTGYDITVVSEV